MDGHIINVPVPPRVTPGVVFQCQMPAPQYKMVALATIRAGISTKAKRNRRRHPVGPRSTVDHLGRCADSGRTDHASLGGGNHFIIVSLCYNCIVDTLMLSVV